MIKLRPFLPMMALGLLLTAGSGVAQESVSKLKPRPLFNGQNLDGWVPVNTAPSTWSVQDGLLICSGKPIGELRTTEMYQNFILELEWRHLKPAGNAGVFVWADDITARGQPFHRSIEVQVLENAYGNSDSHTTHGDIFPIHGAKMVPLNGRSGDRAFPTEFRAKSSPEWNHYRIECRNGSIALAVNGKVVTRGEECSPRKGYICLESEGGVVHYRNIHITQLPDSPIEAKDVAVANRNFRCLYNGIDISEWRATGEWEPDDWVLRHTGETEGRIVTAETFSDIGFIVDYRTRVQQHETSVVFRGVRVNLGSASPYKEHLRPNEWNRVAAESNGGRLTLRINGVEIEATELVSTASNGPLTLEADGVVEFANIYVRELPE